MIRPVLMAAAALVLIPAAGAAQQQHTVFLHEYSGGFHIVPEQIHAKVGDIVALTIENDGTSVHNFLVCGDGTSPLEKCDDRWGFTGMIEPNATARVTVTAKKAGTFDYYCYIPGHKGGGMKGQLVVQEASAAKNEVPAPAIGALAGLLVVAALIGRRRT